MAAGSRGASRASLRWGAWRSRATARGRWSPRGRRGRRRARHVRHTRPRGRPHAQRLRGRRARRRARGPPPGRARNVLRPRDGEVVERGCPGSTPASPDFAAGVALHYGDRAGVTAVIARLVDAGTERGVALRGLPRGPLARRSALPRARHRPPVVRRPRAGADALLARGPRRRRDRPRVVRGRAPPRDGRRRRGRACGPSRGRSSGPSRPAPRARARGWPSRPTARRSTGSAAPASSPGTCATAPSGAATRACMTPTWRSRSRRTAGTCCCAGATGRFVCSPSPGRAAPSARCSSPSGAA